MYELNRKSGIDWNEEIAVNITLKELAIMYAVLSNTSTSDAQRVIDRSNIQATIDVRDGDIPYKMYRTTREILRNNGVTVTE